jgi:hypothetical protein
MSDPSEVTGASSDPLIASAIANIQNKVKIRSSRALNVNRKRNGKSKSIAVPGLGVDPFAPVLNQVERSHQKSAVLKLVDMNPASFSQEEGVKTDTRRNLFTNGRDHPLFHQQTNNQLGGSTSVSSLLPAHGEGNVLHKIGGFADYYETQLFNYEPEGSAKRRFLIPIKYRPTIAKIPVSLKYSHTPGEGQVAI